MNNHVEALARALEQNREIIQLLSKRVEMLEDHVEENAGQRMALMLLLRAVVQCSPNRDQVVALVERMTAQMQVQPGILLDGGKSAFLRAKFHLDWMTADAPT